MIIDVHGHYTTAPPALGLWRDRQIASLADPASAPSPSELKISDDELRESIELNQLKKMDERGIDLTIFSPRASFMAHHIGGFETSAAWAAICNELCHRVSLLFPDRFAGAAMLPQSPGVDPASCIPELERCVKDYGFVGINLNPDPSGGHWTSPPLTDRHWYPHLREDGRAPDPRHDPRGARAATRASTRPARTTSTPIRRRSCSASAGDLFKDFPTLKLLIPHGGGAVPYHWGRFRGLAQEMKKPLLGEHLLEQHLLRHLRLSPAGHRPADRRDPGEERPFRLGNDRRGARHRPGDRPCLRRHPPLHRCRRRSGRRGHGTAIYEGNARRVFARLDAAAEEPRAADRGRGARSCMNSVSSIAASPAPTAPHTDRLAPFGVRHRSRGAWAARPDGAVDAADLRRRAACRAPR